MDSDINYFSVYNVALNKICLQYVNIRFQSKDNFRFIFFQIFNGHLFLLLFQYLFQTL